jgi:hypothetical protein
MNTFSLFGQGGQCMVKVENQSTLTALNPVISTLWECGQGGQG